MYDVKKLKPLYNNVIVKPNFDPDTWVPKTSKGMVIVEQQKPLIKYLSGTVVAVGSGMITPDGSLMPLTLKPGDQVLFLRGTGIELKEFVDDEVLFVFKETDLMCVLET